MPARPARPLRRLGPLLLLVPVLVAGGPAEATLPGSNGKIVFEGTHKDNDGEILKVEPQGGQVVPITDDLLQDSDPAVSPSGKRVAYSKHSGGMGGDTEIYVARMDGDGEHRVTRGPDDGKFPAWTPNGKSLVYVRFIKGGAGELFKVRIGQDPKRGRRLTETKGYEFEPDVSSQGRIAFEYSVAKGQSDLFKMRLDGTHRRRLTDTENRIEGAPSWAPGGNKLAFTTLVALVKNTSDIAVMRSDGSRRRKLVERDLLNLFYPSWSPNGEQIAAAARNGDSDWKIVRFPSDDGTPLTNVTTFDQGGLNPSWQSK